MRGVGISLHIGDIGRWRCYAERGLTEGVGVSFDERRLGEGGC